MTAVIPRISGANFAVINIVVGPSAPPIIPIAAASRISKIPVARAPQKAAKIPIWAAAPRSKVRGLAISGPKSVPAPSPKNISGGSMFQNASP